MVDCSKLDVAMTQEYIDALDHLVEEGIYLNRGEIIMEALRILLGQHGIEPFSSKVAEKPESSD